MENTPKFTPETLFIEYDALGKLIDLPAEQFSTDFAKPRSIVVARTVAHDMGIDIGGPECTALQEDIEFGLLKLYQTKKLEKLYKEASQYVPSEGRTIVTFQFFEHSIVVGVLDADTQTKLYATTMESYR